MLVIRTKIPRQIELRNYFIRRVAFKFQLTPHVVIETRCIRAVKIAVRWIVFEILAGGIAVNAFEAAIQAADGAVLVYCTDTAPFTVRWLVVASRKSLLFNCRVVTSVE